MDDHTPDAITSLLLAYEKVLKRLKRRRTLTANASTTFAELASRVDAEIDRRSGVERRADLRATLDRRERRPSTEPAVPRPYSGAHLRNRG